MGTGGGGVVGGVSKKLALGEHISHAKPPFSISQIKKAIPPHCFERSLLRSLSYPLSDLIYATTLYYISDTYFHLIPHPYHYLAWPIYWFSQGCVFLALWVVAHECGHHAFSDYQWVDDLVGLLIHTSVLVPYFSFKISHRRHHSNTGSIERDEVFVPKPKHQMPWYFKYLTNPPARVVIILITLTLGWTMYLGFNISGRFYDRFASHYDPNSPIFSKKERLQVHVSNAFLLTMYYLLYRIAMGKGLSWFICMYGIPLVIMNSLIVLITSLQHTHPSFPYYDSSEWEWLRGNLVTVDRDYWFLNKVFHNITDTHVVHHLFPTMPHYNAMEATKAVKPFLGDYYNYDGTNIIKAAWREFRECIYVEEEPDLDAHKSTKGVFWYRNKL